ncbi:zinc finger BED domain-containing protein RICESLEEPER 4-like [Daucus carota subsp. sativus]|uniref:zinc finger BED domain-containing protein RICESLEEPER 4-like n=1 Tax=Daucus carota subsp. sativus TaxID=79200 RepID=UPI0007EF4F5F|nr:PREDICTED: zinc finger BED domain-containing protein RICESLEEPER 4-like [Daucus carota subsp. sativus]
MAQRDSQDRDIGMGDSNDAQTQTQASSKKKRKTMEERSEVWDHFTKFTDAKGCLRARCNHSENPSTNGTSALSKHLKSCKKLPLSGESKQTQLSLHSVGGNECILKKWHFDQKTSRHKLAAMIIIDELPFRFVEGEGFKDFMNTTQPLFKMPSRL